MRKKQKNNQAGNTAPAKKESASENVQDAIKNQATVPTASDVEKKEALTKEQTVALAKHEGVIEEHLTDFLKIGLALKAILDGRLYRETHTDFDDYCEERWDFSGSHARRLITAADCMGVLEKEISPSGEKTVLPRNEAQVRALTEARENPKKWTKAWQKVLKATEGKGITAERITEILGVKEKSKTPGTKKALGHAAADPEKKLTRIGEVVAKALKMDEPTIGELKRALEQIQKLLPKKG